MKYGFLSENLKGGDHLDTHGKIILKRILNK
jgi:hypothetical protein